MPYNSVIPLILKEVHIQINSLYCPKKDTRQTTHDLVNKK